MSKEDAKESGDSGYFVQMKKGNTTERSTQIRQDGCWFNDV